MLKRYLSMALTGLFIYLFFAGSSYGPAAAYDGNLTGSTGGTASCYSGSSCHGSNSSTTSLTISFCDSGSTSTRTTYQPNHFYTVRLSGSNTLSRARFGFQCSSTNSSGAQAGRFRAVASYTDTVHNSSTGTIQVVEHSSPIAGSSGSYSTYFNWKAPASGTGDVTFYAILNAVNYNGSADTGDKPNTASPLTISEATATYITAFGEDFNLQVYPNPVSAYLSLQMQHALPGTYTINVFNPSGKTVYSQQSNLEKADYAISINTNDWAPGIYFLLVEKDNKQLLNKIIKN